MVDDSYEDDEEEEVAMAEWNWGKKTVIMPNPWGRGVKESYDFASLSVRDPRDTPQGREN